MPPKGAGFGSVDGAMIVRQFLHWVRQAPAGERAEATSALARAYLYSDLSSDDRAAAEGAMIMLLDDPSSLVRGALAEALASDENAPRIVVHALASDQPDVALPVLMRSPLLLEDDLVDDSGQHIRSFRAGAIRQDVDIFRPGQGENFIADAPKPVKTPDPAVSVSVPLLESMA